VRTQPPFFVRVGQPVLGHPLLALDRRCAAIVRADGSPDPAGSRNGLPSERVWWPVLSSASDNQGMRVLREKRRVSGPRSPAHRRRLGNQARNPERFAQTLRQRPDDIQATATPGLAHVEPLRGNPYLRPPQATGG